MLNITHHQGNANQNHSKTSPHTCHNESESHSVVSDSLRPRGLYPAGSLCLWDSPGKSTGVGCHFLLQGVFPTQGLNLGLLHGRQILYCLSHQGNSRVIMVVIKKTTNNKCRWGCEEKGTLMCCCWEYRLLPPLWKTVWWFLKKLKIELS